MVKSVLKKRIIPCLDVRDSQVVKGIQFRNHEVVGDIIDLAVRYSENGADELVFYDITASSDGRQVEKDWVAKVAQNINIPFCVAGGIRSVSDAEIILANGADKISINSPALEYPNLITDMAKRFGSQCVVVGIDSLNIDGNYFVNQYTGDINKTICTSRVTLEWALEVADRGAGEIVLNCMNQDGVKKGYDILQTKMLTDNIDIPVIASGGAGSLPDFLELFTKTGATGALAASVFHKQILNIKELKSYLLENDQPIRV